MRNNIGEAMDKSTLGGYNSINAFVSAKLSRYDSSSRDFAALFELMFSERENILYERSSGYRIHTTTYGEAHGHILRRAEKLRVLLDGCGHDRAVGIYLDNSLDWIELFWAVLAAGFCPLLLNRRLDLNTLEDALSAVDACAVISDGREFSVRTLSPGEVCEAERGIESPSFGKELYVMSSGTTAHVKVCAYSAEEFYYQIHGSYSMISQCAQVKKHYDGRLKLLTFLPFYHIFGLVAVYIWFAFFSRTFVELRDMEPSTVTGTIRRHKVTHVFAVPLFWERVYEQAMRSVRERGPETAAKLEKGLKISRRIGDVPLLGRTFSRLAFRAVRDEMFGESIVFMITGGSYISPQVMEFFNAIGYRLADGYGMTEIGITSVELRSSKRLLNSCSVGLPMEGVEYKINDDGELLVRGRAMARCIIEDGIRHKNDGWFNTRDLASFDGKCYRILGRQDDLIIAPNGENLNPNLIEERLSVSGAKGVCLIGAGSAPKTAPVLLVSVSRAITGESLSALDRELKIRLNELMLGGQVTEIYYTTDSLLQGEEFKLNRRRLKADYENGSLTAAQPEKSDVQGELDDTARLIRAMFAHALSKSEEDIGYNSDFFLDEGGSSLDWFGVISQLEEYFGVPFPSDNSTLNTVKGLRDYLAEHGV